MDFILLAGIAIFCGAVVAWFVHKLNVPQIIGYVALGVLIGPVLKIMPPATVSNFEPFNLFALGLIGFLIGGELDRSIFVRFGRQVIIMLLFEGIMAFLLVGILSFVVMICFTSWTQALAVSVVFGAICSATDPASTIGVLWEYKARGPLTTMLTALVALDDALALVLYAIGVSVAGIVTGHQEQGFISALTGSLYHIFGSVVLGVAAGLILCRILKHIKDAPKVLAFTTGMILVIVGLEPKLELDVIIAAMSMGVVLINSDTHRMKSCFELMHKFSEPIYILFFVFVGARLDISSLNTLIILLSIVYVLGSIVGKTSGAYLGGLYAGAVKNVRKYLGFCLYPQGGIAVGLLIMAGKKFDTQTGQLMLFVVIVGAFVLQVIGPFGVKYGAGKAGEIGLNITEDDLILGYNVSDVMIDVTTIAPGMTLAEVIKLVSTTDSFYYPVLDDDRRMIGAITLDGIRNTFATQELNDWLIAMDISEPVKDTVTDTLALSDALQMADELNVDFLPVLTETGGYAGILDISAVRRRLSAEVLAKQKEADGMYSLGVV